MSMNKQIEGDLCKRTVLTIAGSDCSGGAGIQADLKTMIANGVYGMSVITALTAQNTMGVAGVMNVTPEFLAQQLDSIFTDIFPDAVKIGMMSSAELIRTAARKLQEYQAVRIVVDPVMISTSGSRLLDEEAVNVLKDELFPLAELITPNIPEAEVLSGIQIHSAEDMIRAAEIISRNCGTSVLVKGGHSINDANDLLYQNDIALWIEGKRIDNPNTHGTGCTLSSAIASNLAKGYDLEEAVRRAKDYLSDALRAMLDLGKGSGPMDHGFAYRAEEEIPGHMHLQTEMYSGIHEQVHTHDHKKMHGHAHVHPNAKAVSNRLAKAVGHLESVKRMVDRGEDCSEVLIQLAAVRSAINNAGKVLLMDHLNHCIVDAVEDGNMESIEEFGEALQKFVK